MTDVITPHDVLRAYAAGLFPMADGAQSPDFHWYDPPARALLPLRSLHVPRRLRRMLRQAPFTVRTDTAFAAVIDGCAAPTPQRPKTWINPGIRALFVALHEAGFAHSVECWQGERLTGGVYGLALGGAFFAESMFSQVTGASKVALLHLAARLAHGGFTLLDAQFVNPHLRQFGVFEIPRTEYRARLAAAIATPGDFHAAQASGIDEGALISAYLAKIK